MQLRLSSVLNTVSKNICSLYGSSSSTGAQYICTFSLQRYRIFVRTLPTLSAAVGFIACKKRGLQLHLLSALGEIWRGGGLPLEGEAKKEFVGLSVVMKAEGRGEQLVGRRQLQDSGENCLGI